MEFTSLFDEASRDVEAEGVERIRTSASIAATETAWPFLALAQSESEFGHRLAMVEDRLTAIASEHGLSFEDVAKPLREGFMATLAARVEASSMTCANCGHSNAAHSQGALCDCGCPSFEPKVKTSSKVAGGAHPFADHIEQMEAAAPGSKYHATIRPFKEDGSLASNGSSVIVQKKDDGRWYQGTIDKKGRTPAEFHSALDALDGSTRDGNKIVVTRRKFGDASFMDDSDLPDEMRNRGGILPRGGAKTAASTDKDGNPDPPPEQRYQCPDCHGMGMSYDISSDGGIQHCPTCEDSGYVYRQRRDDSEGGHGRKDFDFTPAPKMASISGDFDQRMATLKQALEEGQDPLAWLAGDQPQATPTHHNETEQFTGDPTPAVDKATATRRVLANLNLASMEPGEERQFHIPGDEQHQVKVRYHNEQANGDDGRPAPGFYTGGYSVDYPNGQNKYFRHTPHGPGLEGAKGYAADQARASIMQHLRYHKDCPAQGEDSGSPDFR